MSTATMVVRPSYWNTILDADESCAFLTNKLIRREPFIYVRFGDADIDWMCGGNTPTCDGELHRPGIMNELLNAWDTLLQLPHFYLGDAASFSTPTYSLIMDGYRELRRGHVIRDLHTEALLLHRKSQPLLEFYRTLAADTRIKVLVGPHRITNATSMLGAYFYGVHATQASESAKLTADVLSGVSWEILLTACGRASKLIAARLGERFPDRTIIELGSAMDPLFVGCTRSEQLPMDEAREFVGELL